MRADVHTDNLTILVQFIVRSTERIGSNRTGISLNMTDWVGMHAVQHFARDMAHSTHMSYLNAQTWTCLNSLVPMPRTYRRKTKRQPVEPSRCFRLNPEIRVGRLFVQCLCYC